jgi:predicted nucleic acid-binding protein
VKIFFDTSAIVELERKNKLIIDLIKRLINKNADLYISVITLSEILTGCYLRDDCERASLEAKRVLSQFIWMDVDSKIAEKTAEFLAHLIKNGKIIEYQDIVIGAAFNIVRGDCILTLNKKHFDFIAELKGKVFTPKELAEKISGRM